MTAVSDVRTLLKTMEPVLNPGVYAFVSVSGLEGIDQAKVVALVRECEGISVVLPEEDAEALGLDILARCSWISLTAHSDLESIGLTAAFSRVLAESSISCNVVAGASHDHIFVPVSCADKAMAALLRLQADAHQDI